MAQSRGCGWLSFTYNDPSIFPEYARACAEAARAVGVRSCWVTNGYATEEQLDYLGDLVVAMNIDLKGSDAFYRKLCGARLAPVQATIASAVRRGIWVEVTPTTTCRTAGARRSLSSSAQLARRTAFLAISTFFQLKSVVLPSDEPPCRHC
jgi:pyruvate-formate lyase-activating enzyme